MAQTRSAKNKAIRQENLREQLAAQGHVQQVVNIAKKLNRDGNKMKATTIQAKIAAANIHLKLINKYLPDLKQVEIEGDIDGTLTIIRKEYQPSK